MTCGRCKGTGSVPAGRILGTPLKALGVVVKKCPECGGRGTVDDTWTEADEIGATTIHETKTKK